MTVAPAVSCGVCATPLKASATRCPSCGASASTAPATAAGNLPTLLAGCVPAPAGSRALAIAVDAIVLLALAAAVVLVPEPLGAAGWAVPALYVLVTVLLLALTGRTLGGLLAAVRTVDLFTGLPLGLGRTLTPWRADGVSLDVRKGRDPLRTTSSARPGSPATRAAAPASAGTSWAPAPGWNPAAGAHPATGAAPAAAGGWSARPSSAPAPGAAPAPAPVAQRSAPAAPAPATQAPGPAPAPAPPQPAAPAPAAPAPAAPAPAAPVPAGQAPAAAPSRPVARPTGVVVTTADGGRFTITGTALLGRNPQPRGGEHIDTLVPVNDLQRTVSKTHASLRWDGRTLWLTDRDSTNGTAIISPSGNQQHVQARSETAVEPGSTIELGDQTLTVTLHGEGDAR